MRSIPSSPSLPYSPRLPRMNPVPPHHSRHSRPRTSSSSRKAYYKRPTVILAAVLTVYLLSRWARSGPSSEEVVLTEQDAAQGAFASRKVVLRPKKKKDLPVRDENEAIDPRASYHAKLVAEAKADREEGEREAREEAKAKAKAAQEGRLKRKDGGGKAQGKKKSQAREAVRATNSSASASSVVGAEVYEYERGYLHYPSLAPSSSSASSSSKKRGEYAQGEVRHPISHLIEQAAKKWSAMLARQSTSLPQATREYKRRYGGRLPPRGFDKWWKFAQDNGVVLVDEYDQINTDIAPFLSLPSALNLGRAERVVRGKGPMPASSIFVVEVRHGEAHLLHGPNIQTTRAQDVLENVRKIAQYLPDMRIPYTHEDGPGVVVSGEEKAMHLSVAKQGRKMSRDEVDNLHTVVDLTLPLWEGACAPGSALRTAFTGERTGQTASRPAGGSFIGLDHMQAIDVCAHPEHRLQHGQTLGEGNTRTELYPLVASSKTVMHSDLLTTPMEQFDTPVGIDPVWAMKAHNKVLWRGSTTGAWNGRNLHWRASHRPRLVTLTNSKAGKRELLYSSREEGDTMRSKLVPETQANQLFDVAYAGDPLQCNYHPGVDETCVYMKNQMRFTPHMSIDEGNNYKYVLDVDGNAWSGRFHRLMASSACVFKSTIYPEWWTTRAVPWYHYVPIKVDYSDLHNAAAYFIGVPGEKGTGGHDEQGRLIGKQGKEWAERHWREEDMLAYQLRLFLELARALYGEEGDYDYSG